MENHSVTTAPGTDLSGVRNGSNFATREILEINNLTKPPDRSSAGPDTLTLIFVSIARTKCFIQPKRLLRQPN